MITFSESQKKIIDALCKEANGSMVNRAHWIDNYNGTISCSYCHTWFNKDDRYYYMRYCPSCGAKMVEVQESEDNE